MVTLDFYREYLDLPKVCVKCGAQILPKKKPTDLSRNFSISKKKSRFSNGSYGFPFATRISYPNLSRNLSISKTDPGMKRTAMRFKAHTLDGLGS